MESPPSDDTKPNPAGIGKQGRTETLIWRWKGRAGPGTGMRRRRTAIECDRVWKPQGEGRAMSGWVESRGRLLVPPMLCARSLLRTGVNGEGT